jgi:hypothetical protein
VATVADTIRIIVRAGKAVSGVGRRFEKLVEAGVDMLYYKRFIETRELLTGGDRGVSQHSSTSPSQRCGE